jgi:glycosyltransferase involved in cell wall biosynthesis
VLWVDKESAESIANAIETLYNDHALRHAMSENNRQVAKKFTRTQVCAGMHEAMMSINHQ